MGLVRRMWREVGLALVLPLLAGCATTSHLATGASGGPAKGGVRVQLPAVVDGVPLARLAQIARTEALAWSEPRPWNVRAGIGSDRAANALQGRDGMTYDYGDTTTRYVVALDGHFSCGECGGSPLVAPPSTSSTTATTAVPVATMVLTVDPTTVTRDSSFRLVDHEVDMSTLGKVYSLDAYLVALEDQSSPAGEAWSEGPNPSPRSPACPPGAGPSWVGGTFCGPTPGPGNGAGLDGECTGSETAPPCGPGAVPGHYYAYTLPVRCDGRIIFDGRAWVSELPPPQDGPPMYVWMALSSDGHAGFIGPQGAVGFEPYAAQAPSVCQSPPASPPAPTGPPPPAG